MMLPPLYEHQKEALARLQKNDVFALLMDMGTGKSRVIIEEWKQRADHNLLVIAPKGVYRNWRLEIEKYTEPNSVVIAHWVSGANKTQKASIDFILKPNEKRRAFLVNIEALSSVKAARLAIEKFIKSGKTIIVADESTRLKSFTSNRTKEIIEIGSQVKIKRILSGLVTPNSPMDLFSQFLFLDWRILGFRNYYSFRSRYAIMKKMVYAGRSFDTIVGYRNLEELQKKINPFSYRVLKDVCLDLPPKIFTERSVELTEEQNRLYKNLVKNATVMLDSGEFVTSTTAMSLILRLHQIVCGHVRDDNGEIREIDASTREKELLETLEECQGKAIIWCCYRVTLQRIITLIKDKYGQDSVVEYWGDTSDENREIAKHRFQNDPKCRWFVGNPQTGGLGLTLTEANLVVYYSNSYDLEHRSQSEDRAHRAGLQHPVTYVDLVAENTVDEKILKALKQKINIAAIVTGERVREWIR